MRAWKVGFIVLATGLLLGCRPNPVANDPSEALLVAVEGTVLLDREGWSTPIPVSVGAVVGPTDLLEAEQRAVLLCADLNVGQVVAERRTPPCPVQGGVLKINGFETRFQRSVPGEVPYILYPRNTLVLEPRPLLRWHDTGAPGYTVTIRDANKGTTVFTRSGVAGDRLLYPEDEFPLQEDVEYQVIVRDESTGTDSTEEGVVGLGFRVVSTAHRLEIEQQRRQIHGNLSEFDPSAANIAMAVYLAGLPLESGHGFWGESWLLLQGVAETQPSPRVDLWRGDMLAAMKLRAEAEEAYQAALEGATMSGDVEAQAAANAGLWCVTRNRAQFDEASRLYKSLGDGNQIEELCAKQAE